MCSGTEGSGIAHAQSIGADVVAIIARCRSIAGLDSPGKTHGDDTLVPASPMTAPGVPRHFALHASALYYFARG